jgi:hypothetical protein
MLEFEQKRTLSRSSGVAGVQEFRRQSAVAAKFQGSNLVQMVEVTNID